MPSPPAPAAAPDPAGGTNSGGGIQRDPNAFPGGPGGLPPDDSPDGPPNGNTSAPLPIVLDLAGDGLAVTQLTSSNTFEAIDTDGYQHRTAWAGTGNAVLFVDPNGLDTIRDADQYIFTDWDPSATTDMEALRDVFDTNHDGSLDAGDAAFGQFKLMVTNADGTTSVETLAEAGISAIDLTATAVTQDFADGSSIDGETTFTRADGTTGTVAAVTFAADANGYAVQTTTTVEADGSTTVDNRALNANGSLNNDTSSTTSADGTTRTISYDDSGVGVIDRTQTLTDTVDGDGSRTETISNFDGQGQLTGSTSTTTAANGDITIDRDLTGGGITNQIETRATGPNGDIADIVRDVSADGTEIDRTYTRIGADGLGRDVEVDHVGGGSPLTTYDHSTVYRTTVAADGTRTETIIDINHDQSATASTTIVTSPDAQTRTSSIDLDADGALDRVVVAQTAYDATGDVTTTTTTLNGDQSAVLGTTATTVSADGLSVTTQMDMDGDGIFDRTTGDVTVTNPRGGQTEDVTVTSADGTLLSEVLTARSTDGVSRNSATYDGAGHVLSSDEIGVGPQGATDEDAATFGMDGTLLGETRRTTSADGLTTTTRTDNAGDGTYDRVTVDQTIENGNGSATEVAGTRAADGTLLGRTVVDTSADGLTVVTRVDSTGAQNADGTAIFDRTTTDATSYTDDGSRIRTVTVTAADGTVLSSVTSDTGADRQSHSVTTDANGDGFATTSEQVSTAADGTVTDSITDLNPDGSTVDAAVRTSSANGLHVTTQIDAAGSGKYNRTTTDDTTIDDAGQRAEVVTDTAYDGTVVGRTVLLSQANGDSSSMRMDSTGNGIFDHVTNTDTAHNADGGTTVTVTDKAADRSTRDQTVTTTSGDGLSSTVARDLDGDGTADRTMAMTMVYNADGSIATTTTDTDASGLRAETDTSVSDNGRTTVSNTSYFGSVVYSTAEALTVGSEGSHYDDLLVDDQAGTIVKETLTTTSGNGLSTTVQVDVNGDGTFDTTMVDATVLGTDGGRTETMTMSGSAGLNGQTVVTTSGNGLSKTTTTDATGNGTIDTTTHDDTVLNADGSRLETYTQTDQDGSLRTSTTVATSADGKHVSIARVLGQDGSQDETIDRGPDGTVTDVLTDLGVMGLALGGETVTTSANGLVKTATYTDAAGTVQDSQNDTRVLNDDGSTTEQFSDVDAQAGISAVFTIRTSGNGLVRTTSAQFSDLLFTDYSTLDTTTLNNDGTLNDTITTSNADLSTRDVSVRTVSADALVTTASLDDDADGNAEIVDQKTTATDGSSVHTTTIYDSATHAQDRQDTVTTSADGRTITLQSARDGDTTVRYTEVATQNPDGTFSDKSQFTSGALAPSWTQIRSQTLDTTGGQTVVISNYDADGGLDDQASTTVSGNGLVVQTALDTTGNGTADLIRTDSTAINADGSRLETVQKVLAPGVLMSGPGTMGYGRTVATSADGLAVTTTTDDDGNGHSEKTETSVRGIDGSLVDTVTFNDNSTGEAVMAQAVDGTMSAGIVKTTSADGLVVTTTVGDVVTQKTFVAGSNGSYAWSQNVNGIYPLPSASHNVDVNGIDTWTSTYIPDVQTGPVFNTNVTTTIQIDTAKEQAAVAQANAIYQTVLDRPMMDAEQESLIQYMQGGILDRQALATSLIEPSAAFDLIFIDTAYENDFGHDPSASDTAAYLKELQSGDRTQTHAEVVVDIAERAVNEQAGNGLLQLLPGAPQATPMTVTLISPETAAATDTGANYAAFANAIGKPSGNLTPGQISQFAALTGDTGATTAPQIDFASASSSTSGQGTAVPGFFSSTSGSTAKAPSGGAAGPLVVNLAGGKVHTTDLATSTVTFDDTGSGTAATTAWTTPNEGFLVLDPLGAQVTDGSSMIPTFSALGQYDLNGDGTLTATEAAAAGVKIWVDANADGVDQAGEVESLGQAGITSIDLQDVQTGSYDHGNVIAADSSVAFSGGQTGDIADAWLAYGGALAQGAVYQFGDDVVIRAADGTASELLYGTGETLDAGAVGLSKIVDVGSNNILQAGTGATVTLSGAAGDRLVGGSGTDTLLAIGDGETVKTGSGTGTVDVSGANTSVDASLGTSTISLDGANDSVSGATSATTIAVTKGTGATIAATGSRITIEGGVGAEISGSGDTVTAAGHSAITLDAASSTLVSDAASTVTLNGSNDTLQLDRGSTVTVAGTGETISLISGTLTLAAGASAAVTGNGDGVMQAGGSHLTLVGRDGAVDVTGAGAVTALDFGNVLLEDNSSDVLTGTGDQVVQGASTTLSLTGTSASLVVTGTGNRSTLSDARVTIQSGASSQVTGSRDVITAGPTGLSGTLVGSDDHITISGTGGQVSLDGARDDVTMDGGTLQLADGSSVTLTGSTNTITLGFDDSLVVDGTDDAVTTSGNDDTLILGGSNNTADLYGTDESVTDSGDGNTLDLHGRGIVTVTGSNDVVTAYEDDTTVSITGANDTLNAYGNDETVTLSGANDTASIYGIDEIATVSGTGDTLDFNSHGTVTVTGSNDVVTAYEDDTTVSITGANDTLNAYGNDETVTLGGADDTASIYGIDEIATVSGTGDTLDFNSHGTVTVTGSNDVVTAYEDDTTVSITGANDTLNAYGNDETVTLGGADDTASIYGIDEIATVSGTGDTLDFNSHGTVTVTGSNNVVTAYEDDTTVSITGANDTLNAYGNDETVTLGGADDTASIYGIDEIATVSGTGDTLDFNSHGAVTVTGSNDVVTAYEDDTTVSITGANDTLNAYGNDETVTLGGADDTASIYGIDEIATVSGTGDTLDFNSHGTVTVTGSNDVVTAYDDDTAIAITGVNDIITTYGNQNAVTLGGSNDKVSVVSGTVSLSDSVSGTIDGNCNTITLGAGDVVGVNGSGNSITLNKTGNTVLLQSDGGGTNTITAGSISVVQAANGSLSVYGGLASSAVTTSSSSPKIALGNGNIVSSTATPAIIDGYAANGLHSWQDIFDTMSGALKETDQYQYNSSNALLEIDRYNASNVKTRADLYDPTTSAEIGSYLYASNGHVNEVVDLLHNHDWLSQSDGSYKDKTSGAVSKTQPTLR